MRPGRNPLSHGARRLADAAADRCLQRAGCQPTDVDLLVNVGVYREKGLGEPALAALIQQDIDAGLGHPPVGPGHGTFSFDVDNGACGVLTGVRLARGFLESAAVALALVVASDSARGPLLRSELPYAEGGGAVLLRWDESTPGFVAMSQQTFPEYDGLLEGYYEWVPRRRLRPGAPEGRNRMTVLERPGYAEHALDCAQQVAADFLAGQQLRAPDVGLLVASGAPGLTDALADRLGVPHTRVAHLSEDAVGMHTAEPLAAVESAMRTGRWQEAGTVLFVSVGSGLTVATALYRH